MKHKLYTIRPTTDPDMFDQFAAMMAASDPWWTLGMDAAACRTGFNTRALRLYQEVGFTLIGTLKDFLVPGFDELLLRKTIGPRIGYKK